MSLLAIDIGNTNTVFGLFDRERLEAHWRIETNPRRTADELALVLSQLFGLKKLPLDRVKHAILASVVPPAVAAVETLCADTLHVPIAVVGPGFKTGMPILAENPREVGADRIVNAVAAYDRVKGGVIAVDFGTATTWDVVTPKGEYMGGAIAPGIQVSAEALYRHAAKLPRIEIARPKDVVGKNTVASMQSGLFYGYAGMVDSMVARIRAEIGFPARCIATGGLATLVAEATSAIDEVDDFLTLKGLQILFARNK
jgi:type III pantothenate kinase